MKTMIYLFKIERAGFKTSPSLQTKTMYNTNRTILRQIMSYPQEL